MDEERETAQMPPYIGYATFVSLLDWFKEMKVVPHEWDRSLWSSKYSGSVGAQLATGLRFLGLMKGNKITPELEQLALADADERKQLIKEILRGAYGPDFVDSLARKTPKNLEDRLRELGASDATIRKAESFFINALKVTGATVPANIAKRARIRVAGATRKPNAKNSHKEAKDEPAPVPRPNPKPTGDESPNQHLALNGLHPVVLALLKDLEAKAPKWTKSERDSCIAFFRGSLDYAYPAVDAQIKEE